ncbi:MAG TPA: hypothetical protein VGK59_23630 [Ohtaekwangia sp.]
MKNLPERELFNNLESRLRQYTEEPDEDSWNHIASALRPGGNKRPTIWFERTTDMLAILLLIFLLWNTGKVAIDATPLVSDISHTSNDSATRNKTTALATEIPDSEDAGKETTFSENSPVQLIGNETAGENHETLPEPVQMLSDPDYVRDSATVLLQSHGKTQSTNAIPIQTDSSVVKSTPVDSVASIDQNIQEKKNKKKIRKHTQLYFTATPSLAFQKMTPTENDQVVVKGIVPESIMSTNRLGISLETGFQRRILKKLEVYGGISYYQQDQKITYEYQSNGSVVVEEADDGIVFSPAIEQREFEYSMRNLGISTGIFYQIKGGNLQHKAGIGLQYHQGLVKASEGSGYTNASSSYLSYQLSYRMQLQVNKRTSIFLQPNFTHSFYTQEKLDQPFELKPYRAGLGIGLLYSF